MAAVDEELGGTSFTSSVAIAAPIELVFQQLSTLEGIGAWWEGSISGEPAEQGELVFGLIDADGYTRMRVDSQIFPTDVAWSVLEDSSYGGEWIHTSMVFHLEEELDASTVLSLHHHGLTPVLDCFADCSSGWNEHLRRIKQAAEALASAS